MKLIASDHFHIFKNRGVPPQVYLAQHPDDIYRHVSLIEVPKSEGSAVIDKKKQVNAIESFIKIISGKKYPVSAPFMLIGSRSYDFIAQQIALKITVELTSHHGPSFHWHSVYGNTQDKLRDTSDFDAKGCRCLVIGNIAENSTNMKLEKVRDILNMYSELPRVVCVGGMDPVQFSKQQLHVRPDIFINC